MLRNLAPIVEGLGRAFRREGVLLIPRSDFHRWTEGQGVGVRSPGAENDCCTANSKSGFLAMSERPILLQDFGPVASASHPRRYAEAPKLVALVSKTLHRNFGERYTWPGNVRELELATKRIFPHDAPNRVHGGA